MKGVRKEQKVIGRNGALGTTTGGKRKCQMEGCDSQQVAVRWEDGTLSFICMRAMSFKSDVWKVMEAA
jgi:hypothetical protein